MRRLSLVLLILGSLEIASAQGAGDTVTCSITPSLAGCYLERPAFAWGNLSVSYGVDAQAAWADDRESHLAPYALIAYDSDRWGAWLELALPRSRVPVIGRADPWRFGVRFTF